MVIGGVALLTRKRFFMSALSSFVEDKGSRFLLAALDTIFGLFVIHLHTDWSSLPAGIITFIGYAALIKGAIGILAKDATIEKFATTFKEKKWYFAEALVVILVGVYLIAYGFNWL